MIYKHGAYSINCHVDEVASDPEFNSAGVLMRSTRRHVISGLVRGADQAAIKTAIQAFETAFLSTSVTTSGLYHSDGTTPSAHYIDTGAGPTEKGITCRVRWVSPPARAEYTLYRSFQAMIECTFLGAGADEFEFSTQFIKYGGLPVIVDRLTVDLGATQHQAYPASHFGMIETGRKVSRAGVVVANPPLIPGTPPLVRRQTASGNEQSGDGIKRWFATWTYTYSSPTAFA